MRLDGDDHACGLGYAAELAEEASATRKEASSDRRTSLKTAARCQTFPNAYSTLNPTHRPLSSSFLWFIFGIL